MSATVSRPFVGPDDLELLIEFASRTTARRLPGQMYYHPGDITWQLYNVRGETEDVGLWTEAGRVVALAIYEAPLNFQFDVEPAADAAGRLSGEVIDWAEGRRRATPDDEQAPIAYRMLGKGTLSIPVFESDDERRVLLETRGYERIDRGGTRFEVSLAEPLIEASLPPGALLRYPADADIPERAELHRDAWSVWGPSRFSDGRYRRLRAAPGYDERLDVVLEYQDRLVSYCVCWADDGSGVGYFEPVGTRPSAAGMGFGRATIVEGLRRLRERGMSIARTGTASVNDPAQALYRSAGLRPVEEEPFYTKRIV